MGQGPYLIALTGTIGSGKSTVARFLKEDGAVVIDADDLAREAVERGSAALSGLCDIFGDNILLPDGSLNRKLLAEIIFSSEEKRKQAEQIIHPEVFRLFVERLSNAPEDSIVVYVVPLLFEGGLDLSPFRKIVVVTAEEEDAVARIVERDRCSGESAQRRIAAQLPSSEKAKRADIIIRNDGSIEDLRQKAKELYRELSTCRIKASI